MSTKGNEHLRNVSYFSFKILCYHEIKIKTKFDIDVMRNNLT
jgi:hypothetical protein